MDHFQTLPREIIGEIFEFVGESQNYKCTIVNKQFYSILPPKLREIHHMRHVCIDENNLESLKFFSEENCIKPCCARRACISWDPKIIEYCNSNRFDNDATLDFYELFLRNRSQISDYFNSNPRFFVSESDLFLECIRNCLPLRTFVEMKNYASCTERFHRGICYYESFPDKMENFEEYLEYLFTRDECFQRMLEVKDFRSIDWYIKRCGGRYSKSQLESVLFSDCLEYCLEKSNFFEYYSNRDICDRISRLNYENATILKKHGYLFSLTDVEHSINSRDIRVVELVLKDLDINRITREHMTDACISNSQILKFFAAKCPHLLESSIYPYCCMSEDYKNSFEFLMSCGLQFPQHFVELCIFNAACSNPNIIKYILSIYKNITQRDIEIIIYFKSFELFKIIADKYNLGKQEWFQNTVARNGTAEMMKYISTSNMLYSSTLSECRKTSRKEFVEFVANKRVRRN